MPTSEELRLQLRTAIERQKAAQAAAKNAARASRAALTDEPLELRE